MRPAIIDLDTERLIEVDGLKLVGECLRCGECCLNVNGTPCEYVYSDSTKENGEPIWSCLHQHHKPMSCVLYPYPEESPCKSGALRWVPSGDLHT